MPVEDRRLRVQVLYFAPFRIGDAWALLTAAEEIAQIARVYRWPLAWGEYCPLHGHKVESPRLSWPVRILINYDHRDSGFTVHVLAADAKTPISGWTNVATESALLKLLAYYGCVDLEREKESLRHWGRGSAWCEPKPGLKDLLGIHGLRGQFSDD